MTGLLPQLADRFGAWLLRASLEGSVVILIVLIARWSLRRWLAPRWQYALWLLVVIRLVLPAAPASPTSIFNVPRLLSPQEAALPHAVNDGDLERARSSGPQPRPARPSAWPPRLLATWGTVAAALLIRIAYRSHRLAAPIRRQRPVTRSDVAEILEDCKQEMGVHFPISVVQSSSVATPSLLGFLRPRLLLPERLLETFDRDSLRTLFRHELAHVRRRDILVNWFATLVHVLHWFNPLVAFAMARMRSDRELATDSLVLSRDGNDDTEAYGLVLIHLLEFATRNEMLPGTVGVLENRNDLRRRITMITTHRRDDYRPSLLAAGLLVALGALTLTGTTAVADHRPGAASLSGTLTNDEGAPLGKVTVVAIDAAGREHVGQSNEAGKYDIRVPEGTYIIRAEANGLRALVGPLRAPTGLTTSVDLKLTTEPDVSLSFEGPQDAQALGSMADRLRGGPAAARDVAQLLRSVATAMPDFLWMDGIKVNGSKLLLRGRAEGLERVANFVSQLQKQGGIDGVNLKRVEGAGPLRFEVEGMVKSH